jgi:putative LPS-related regulatory protein
MEKTNWYAVFTASRAEKRVKERLEQAGIENYLPMREVEFVRDGLVKRLEVPVITGCIFVRVSETNLPSVLSILGVIALLKEKQTPIVISGEQLDGLRILNENAESLEVVNTGWPVGTTVRVMQGELAGVRGELIEVAGGHLVVIRIPYLIGVCADVSLDCVKAL